MRTYQPDDLIDFIQTEETIYCTGCKKTESVMALESEIYFFDKGWRVTKDNCYCPECASKKIKNKI